MATQAKPKPTQEKPKQAKLKPIERIQVSFRIVGTSPLIQHAWSDKALKQMRDKHAGNKTKNRDVRDPQKEGEEAAYRTSDGRYGIPAAAVKKAMITAAHKDIGIEKTVVKKAIRIISEDEDNIIPIDCDEPEIREDAVRVQSATDLRYRPYFHRWSADISFEVDAEWLTIESLVNLINRAGFGVGICEWRPEKGGEFGRFQLDTTAEVKVESLS